MTFFMACNIAQCCRKVKQTAYVTYIRPIVEYASHVWDPHTKRNANKIEMVQRRCVRHVIGNCYRTISVTSLLKSLSWPTFEERRHQNRLATMYRMLHNQVNTNWLSFLTKNSPTLSYRLFLPFCKGHVYASSILSSQKQRLE